MLVEIDGGMLLLGFCTGLLYWGMKEGNKAFDLIKEQKIEQSLMKVKDYLVSEFEGVWQSGIEFWRVNFQLSINAWVERLN